MLSRRVGIVPDLNRGGAFATLFVMSALQIVAKAVALAILAATDGTWLTAYIVGDHVLHFVYRILRRDMLNCVAAPPAVTYIVSPICRAMDKVHTDFSGLPLMRLPAYCGGAYWICSIFASHASLFVAVHVYCEYATDPTEDVPKINAGALWTGASALVSTWTIAFAYFASRVAVPRLRHTLWSTVSGTQWVQGFFTEGESDEEKFKIFECNRLKWESDIGSQVSAWTLENWDKWKEEKPAWFKAEQVPDVFVPERELAALGQNRKRRGSAAGSIRESFRESEQAGDEE
jgi:hypothetical protein